MTIALSRADYDLLWQQANPSPETLEQNLAESQGQDYAESVSYVPEQIGRGHIREMRWGGVSLSLFNYQLHNDLRVSSRAENTEPVCREIGFNLSGNRSGKRSGESFIEWGNDDNSGGWTWTTYANDPVLKVDIHLESDERLESLVSEALDSLPRQVRQHIEEGAGGWWSEVNAITPAMRAALEQIFHCPFQGKTKQLYLESKCLELIALKLEQIRHLPRQTSPSPALSPDDIDRIHLAKAILTEALDNPPSLMALAKRVSLNDYKLKTGFRQVFGTTVFGYLHRHRMEEAHRLLAQQRMNVREVALAVGYANQSRFAVAFRKQFGLNPKAYLLSQRSG
ncbi:MAG: AraC family transcriptional regulator [Phormidesmis sp.]